VAMGGKVGREGRVLCIDSDFEVLSLVGLDGGAGAVEPVPAVPAGPDIRRLVLVHFVARNRREEAKMMESTGEMGREPRWMLTRRL